MFYRVNDNGLIVFVRLTPKAAADEMRGVEVTADGKQHLAVRVRAVPEDGKANKALIKLLSKHWKIPANIITLVSGETSRVKQLLFSSHLDMLLPLLQQFHS